MTIKYPVWLNAGDIVDQEGRRITIPGNLGIVQLMNELHELRQRAALPEAATPFIAVGMVQGNGEFTVYNVQIPDGEHVLYIERNGKSARVAEERVLDWVRPCPHETCRACGRQVKSPQEVSQ